VTIEQLDARKGNLQSYEDALHTCPTIAVQSAFAAMMIGALSILTPPDMWARALDTAKTACRTMYPEREIEP